MRRQVVYKDVDGQFPAQVPSSDDWEPSAPPHRTFLRIAVAHSSAKGLLAAAKIQFSRL
jgi:hypothetical protein